ncbi:hypothetical protein HPB47_017806, partial [Ixodes persulcatus]
GRPERSVCSRQQSVSTCRPGRSPPRSPLPGGALRQTQAGPRQRVAKLARTARVFGDAANDRDTRGHNNYGPEERCTTRDCRRQTGELLRELCLVQKTAPANLANESGNRSYELGLAVFPTVHEYLHKEKYKILRPSETRWLVLHQCVERVLQEWETLKLLFLQAATEDRTVAAELILKDMNPITEAYLKFMQYVLGFFNKLNAMFQSKDSLIAVIQVESQRLLRCLCQNFMKPSSIEDPAKLNPLDPRSLLALKELYVGAGCQGILDKITMEGGSSECSKSRKGFRFSGPFFHEVRFVQPSTALSYEARKRLPSFPVLQDRYKHLLPSVGDVEQEWQMLPSFFTESEKIELQTKSADAFWGQVSKTKMFDDKLVLPNIATLAKLVLTLPHSNAETERIFSMLSDMKTRKRNRLGPESVNALLLVKSAMATRGET